MAIAVQIPMSLREHSGVQTEIAVEAQAVGEALGFLRETMPELYRGICDETGAVRQHINLFVNSDWISVREEGWQAMRLCPGDVLTIWTAVSGG